MHETYRMLGREHEADLEREAASRRLAVEVAKGRRDDTGAPQDRRREGRLQLLLGRVAALVGSRS
ncbi:MAG: hypothetical protein ACRDNP_00770 [Gaiellaceae bacterium]